MTTKLKPPYIYSYSTDSFWKIEWAVRVVGREGKEENAYQKAVFGKIRCQLWGLIHLHQWLPLKPEGESNDRA